MDTYVELDTNMAFEGGVAAWTFDVDHWGVCGQGRDEAAALADLAAALDTTVDHLAVRERIYGDELAFTADHQAASEDERRATLDILAAARADTLAFYRSLPPELLDADDPDRVLPSFAKWRTPRAMLWHVCDTDCRYYPDGLGLPRRERAADLDTELAECAAHVRRVVETMPLDLANRYGAEEWTSRKVLRRLAWHERGELVAMRGLALSLARSRGLPPPARPAR
jgi:hypothetical protein